MLSKIIKWLPLVALSLVATGCIKSDVPVLFQETQVSSFEDSSLGLAVGRVYPSGKPTQAYQLKREGEQTYLYICRQVSLGAPPPVIFSKSSETQPPWTIKSVDMSTTCHQKHPEQRAKT